MLVTQDEAKASGILDKTSALSISAMYMTIVRNHCLNLRRQWLNEPVSDKFKKSFTDRTFMCQTSDVYHTHAVIASINASFTDEVKWSASVHMGTLPFAPQ